MINESLESPVKYCILLFFLLEIPTIHVGSCCVNDIHGGSSTGDVEYRRVTKETGELRRVRRGKFKSSPLSTSHARPNNTSRFSQHVIDLVIRCHQKAFCSRGPIGEEMRNPEVALASWDKWTRAFELLTMSILWLLTSFDAHWILERTHLPVVVNLIGASIWIPLRLTLSALDPFWSSIPILLHAVSIPFINALFWWPNRTGGARRTHTKFAASRSGALWKKGLERLVSTKFEFKIPELWCWVVGNRTTRRHHNWWRPVGRWRRYPHYSLNRWRPSQQKRQSCGHVPPSGWLTDTGKQPAHCGRNADATGAGPAQPSGGSRGCWLWRRGMVPSSPHWYWPECRSWRAGWYPEDGSQFQRGRPGCLSTGSLSRDFWTLRSEELPRDTAPFYFLKEHISI